MKPRLSSSRSNVAMTLFEVGVLVAMVVIVVAILLPSLAKSKRKSNKIGCTQNLKQIGLAYRIWEGDNGDIYPMGISITNGGSMEMVATGDVVQTYLVMSNELSTPKILVCPNDTMRIGTTDFQGMANSNISYFVGIDATNENNAQMIISGDGNWNNGGVSVGSGLQSFGAHDLVTWTATRHVNVGNIGLADGSAQEVSDQGLANLLGNTGCATNRFAMP